MLWHMRRQTTRHHRCRSFVTQLCEIVCCPYIKFWTGHQLTLGCALDPPKNCWCQLGNPGMSNTMIFRNDPKSCSPKKSTSFEVARLRIVFHRYLWHYGTTTIWMLSYNPHWNCAAWFSNYDAIWSFNYQTETIDQC